MAKTRLNTKGRRITGQFIAIPAEVLQSKAYKSLPAYSVKLVIDLSGQYNGSNNGDLCAAWIIMKKCGWRSRDTLARHIKLVLQSNLVIKTRQGGKNLPSLYAVTWRPIDYCKGKLDSHIKSSNIPSHAWKNKSLTR